ncbi:hypothetical protein Nans01_27710 [Nocardiopsis ansamitocini]|uniref:Uncharacterized protein n=1 Tax=Nocardiopsis ansamitocini TaxID=1670832 RepID=A0A9W6P761_9ACTN|nr:hypothetical protein Nans01_27710 [Nocardiopsis ansamitocini]
MRWRSRSCRIGGDDLDRQLDGLGTIGGLGGAVLCFGPHDQEVGFGALAGRQDHRRLPTNPQMWGNPHAQSLFQQVHGEAVKKFLRTHENKASVDQLGVRRKVGQPVEVGGGETAGRRNEPVRYRLRGHRLSLPVDGLLMQLSVATERPVPAGRAPRPLPASPTLNCRNWR